MREYGCERGGKRETKSKGEIRRKRVKTELGIKHGGKRKTMKEGRLQERKCRRKVDEEGWRRRKGVGA